MCYCTRSLRIIIRKTKDRFAETIQLLKWAPSPFSSYKQLDEYLIQTFHLDSEIGKGMLREGALCLELYESCYTFEVIAG